MVVVRYVGNQPTVVAVRRKGGGTGKAAAEAKAGVKEELQNGTTGTVMPPAPTQRGRSPSGSGTVAAVLDPHCLAGAAAAAPGPPPPRPPAAAPVVHHVGGRGGGRRGLREDAKG